MTQNSVDLWQEGSTEETNLFRKLLLAREQDSFPKGLRRGDGWKLHLTVSPEDRPAINKLLKRTGVTFKEGRNSGQEGKDFTLYVGPRDLADEVASYLETRAGQRLKPISGDALVGDAPFTPNIAGRFHVPSLDNTFHQYGPWGIPRYNSTVSRMIWGPGREPGSHWAGYNNDSIDAYDQFADLYGTFFTGRFNQSREIRTAFELLGDRRPIDLRDGMPRQTSTLETIPEL